MSVAGLSMVYMAAVATSAATLPRAPAALSAILSVAALNFFFVPPRGSLSVDAAEYWWILMALLALSLGLGAAMGSLRARKAEAELGRARASELHRLSEAMAEASGLDAMSRSAAEFLARATGRPCAIFLRVDDSALARVASSEDAQFDERAAAWAVEHGKAIGAGSFDWPDMPIWCAPFARSAARGAAQFTMPAGARLSHEEAEHWLALTRQAGLALEREGASKTAASAEQARRPSRFATPCWPRSRMTCARPWPASSAARAHCARKDLT
jgi:two-component system sensor histidine kinase KdpD